jgi:hypothetical protein
MKEHLMKQPFKDWYIGTAEQAAHNAELELLKVDISVNDMINEVNKLQRMRAEYRRRLRQSSGFRDEKDFLSMYERTAFIAKDRLKAAIDMDDADDIIQYCRRVVSTAQDYHRAFYVVEQWRAIIA